MNYYKRHIGDYAAATRHLSMIEHGAYTVILDVYYTHEAPLPADIAAAARKVGARGKDEIQAVETILNEFFELTDKGWCHSRCDREIAAMKEKSARNKVIGKSGGRPKKETQTVSENNPDGFQKETQTVSGESDSANPSHKPLATSQELSTNNMGGSFEDCGSNNSENPQKNHPKNQTCITKNFSPDEHGIRLAEKNNLDLAVEMEKFVTHYQANGGSRADWQAQFRKWLLHAAQYRADADKSRVASPQAAVRQAAVNTIPDHSKTVSGRL